MATQLGNVKLPVNAVKSLNASLNQNPSLQLAAILGFGTLLGLRDPRRVVWLTGALSLGLLLREFLLPSRAQNEAKFAKAVVSDRISPPWSPTN